MKDLKNHLFLLCGAMIGGGLGLVACVWMFHHGFYAMILPGGLVGVGAAFFRSRLLIVHILCGILALAAGILTEWYMRPWIPDPSLTFFLTHLADLSTVTHLMIAAGTFLGFFLPFTRGSQAPRPQEK